ncbi:MAG: DASS family sodium-coupled anion symporter [Fimbriimonadaceae bacterium]
MLKFAAALGAFAVASILLRGLEREQALAGSIFALAVVLWITEAVPIAVTALVSTVLLVLLGVASPDTAFGAYGDPVILLFVGSFLLAKSMSESGLDERLSYWLLRYKWATATPRRLLFSLGLVACVLSLFVSNTAVTAMMLPIGVSLLSVISKQSGQSRYGIGMMLMLTWGSSVAVGVIVGTPPNLIAAKEIAEQTGHTISFVEWMQFAMPVNAVMLFAAWVVLMLMYGRGAPRTDEASELAHDSLVKLGPMTPAQRNTMAAFFLALILWLLPDTTAMFLGPEHAWSAWLKDHVSPTVAALLASCLLFFLPTKDGRTLTWKQATTIDWGTILLFGGGIALGAAMFETGLAENLGAQLASASDIDTLWGITALCIILASLMSELASNTASATTIVPVAIGLALGADVNPIPPALGAALGASMGFMLPISTPPNAIVYSSGLVPAKEMIKAGLVLDVIGIVVIWLCLRLLLPILGLA